MKEKLKCKDTGNPAQAHQGDQDPVDHRPLQGVPEEPERLHAQENPAGPCCEGGCHRINKKNFMRRNFLL